MRLEPKARWEYVRLDRYAEGVNFIPKHWEAI